MLFTSNPDVLKQILKDAKQEIERWPQWRRSQEPALRGLPKKLTK